METPSRELSEQFRSVAVFEHHQLVRPTIDVSDISGRLAALWTRISAAIKRAPLSLKQLDVMSLHVQVASAFDEAPGDFRDADAWSSFLDECEAENTHDGDKHFESWALSTLYWNHLTKFRLATAWMLMNARRVQRGQGTCQLPVANLGAFLDSLSSSGPPIYDGQTFYPDDYAAVRWAVDAD